MLTGRNNSSLPSPATTLPIYAHMFEQDDSNSAAAINAALKG
jgi:hypothetical protein